MLEGTVAHRARNVQRQSAGPRTPVHGSRRMPPASALDEIERSFPPKAELPLRANSQEGGSCHQVASGEKRSRACRRPTRRARAAGEARAPWWMSAASCRVVRMASRRAFSRRAFPRGAGQRAAANAAIKNADAGQALRGAPASSTGRCRTLWLGRVSSAPRRRRSSVLPTKLPAFG
eukprot:5128697-Alexandrium_andersonii.AAC.2